MDKEGKNEKQNIEINAENQQKNFKNKEQKTQANRYKNGVNSRTN